MSSSQTGKLIPNLDERSTKVLNLTVLQRIDPFIEEILITAAHVTFYEFNVDINQWSRKDVEGSLFVVKRNTQPRFQFVVMNRRNTENLVENLLEDFEFEIQVPYLLYRNADQEVNGIWFYNSRECEEVGNLFSRILSAYLKVSPKPKLSSTKSEYEELEAVPTSAVIEGPLEPSFTVPAHTDVADDSAFLNFFDAATSIGVTSSKLPNTGPIYYPSAQTLAPTARVPSPTPHVPTLPPHSAAPSLLSLHDGTDRMNKTNQIAALLKPSSFFTPPPMSPAMPMNPMPTSIQTMPSLNPPPLTQQRPHGAPILQPFPPPTPPLSLTSNPTPINVTLSREKVRDALLMLVQDNQFIDLVYQTLSKVHQP
ncbi:unnamed protein product [Cuscuta epithymum]|uniref:mRNA-decapping enzyme-like protein n=1 Tax=Cuscuta epithymum TaxID=186058 RepID=A0AAV0CNB6_9ASTE|nr:unnamed protein product [Cuscuta epithymum]